MPGSASTVPDPGPPPEDPRDIRAALPSMLVPEFDREWAFVLDKVKESKDVDHIHRLINKWRHTLYMEMRDPGSYYRMLATAATTLATGQAPPGSMSGEEVMVLIQRRLSR